MEYWSWLFNTSHLDACFMSSIITTCPSPYKHTTTMYISGVLKCLLIFTGGKPKRPSIITATFQGELEVTTLAGTGKGGAATAMVSAVFCCCLGMQLLCVDTQLSCEDKLGVFTPHWQGLARAVQQQPW